MEDNIYKLLKHHDLKLLLAKSRLHTKDEFPNINEYCGWIKETGDWHVMTTNTNEDKSLGLDGEIAINCMGCWSGGRVSKDVRLKNYGEISFEYYLQNNLIDRMDKREPNILKFYIDGALKLEIKGPCPWYRCDPIGLTPGVHRLTFEYIIPDGNAYGRKAVFDTVTIYEAKDINCIISDYTPPSPIKNITKTSILRGFSIFSQMHESDTKIDFTARFEGIDFHDFIIHCNDIFYFIDEFGICYRGVFENEILPKVVSLKKQYLVELSMTAPSKVGIGFC